jgi:succinate dehydrogenase / fumarate reductase flavoprotein subunit
MTAESGFLKENETRKPNDIPENERDYYLERRYPAFGNLAPRDISSRAAKERIDAGFGIGPLKMQFILIFLKLLKNREKKRSKRNMEIYSICILKLQDMMPIKNP